MKLKGISLSLFYKTNVDNTWIIYLDDKWLKPVSVDNIVHLRQDINNSLYQALLSSVSFYNEWEGMIYNKGNNGKFRMRKMFYFINESVLFITSSHMKVVLRDCV